MEGISVLWAFYLSITLLPFSLVTANANANVYIVQADNNFKPSPFVSAANWYESILFASRPSNGHPAASSQPPQLIYTYETVFHGFAAILTPEQAKELQNKPEIISVDPDELYDLHTTRTPAFLGLTAGTRFPADRGLLAESDGGSNVIVGVIDGGIWPESESFNDRGLSPVPKRWKGECDGGANFPKTLCNNKLVGVRYFKEGYNALVGSNSLSNEPLSARDRRGHGTHTASTIAGMLVRNVSCLGYAMGDARGMAPKARVAAYKVCWGSSGRCSGADILSGIKKAVEDGVDVISISLGGNKPLPANFIAISSFNAIEKGVFVSASAGNSGPGTMTLENDAPWIMTVGASTIDREFPAYLVLENGDVISGSSLYQGKFLPPKQFFPVVDSTPSNSSSLSTVASFCEEGSLDPEFVKGKIVLCKSGGLRHRSAVLKGVVVRKAGGVGVIVAHPPSEGEDVVPPEPHIIPGLDIPYSQYKKLMAYLLADGRKTTRATMSFGGTKLGVKPAPEVAPFSSRGPGNVSTFVLKPDVIAPGVSILAAWPQGLSPSRIPQDPRRTQYNIKSGTSMSCPHVSGLGALLKGAHADWSPAMIRSALMTTAYTVGNDEKPILDGTVHDRVATIWDYGAGHVNPEKANDPGLVYELNAEDYIDFLCAAHFTEQEIKKVTNRAVSCQGKKKKKPWDMNYPAIVVGPNSPKVRQLNLTLTRTVTHVGREAYSSYSVKVISTKSVTITVDPPRLQFNKIGEKRSFRVRISGKRNGHSTREVGTLTWSDGIHSVRSPVVVIWI